MEKDFRFNLEEAAGAIGDYGTLIPIIFGVVAVTDMKLAPILFFFAISYIITGLYYKLPMPVEPMKVIGTVAIAGKLSQMEVAAAGMIAAIIFIIVGVSGTMKYLKELIPNSIIRGIQLGLALTLAKTAVEFISQDFLIGSLAVLLILIFYFAPILDISSLVVFSLGLIWGIYNHGLPPVSLFTWPEFALPALSEFRSGFLTGTLPQIPLTIGNSVLATSLLISDLFDKEVSDSKIITSVGAISLVSSSLGGFPMCHGAGGLAAQYRFGARSGGSNIISGFIILIVALFFASQELVYIIPYGVLGALLFFSALQLSKSSFKSDDLLLTLLTGIIAFITSISVAFIVMLTLFWLKDYTLKIRREKDE